MSEKKLLTALVELSTALMIVYTQDPSARARFYLHLTRASMWSAERLGRLAMRAELAYRKEVGS